MKDTLSVSVVIPYYQESPGLLTKALTSIFGQTYNGVISIIIVDDGSPHSASKELQDLAMLEVRDIDIILLEQENGGAGAARNTALDNIPHDTKYVAFLDSDDEWTPSHIENGIHALELGYDAYFSDHYAALYPEQTNFQRIGTLKLNDHILLDSERHSLRHRH